MYQNFYYSIFIWSSTYFGRHTAHHQEPKTALAHCAWQLPLTTRPTTFHVWKTRGCQCSFRLLMMGGVSAEICWVSYKYGIIKILIHYCILFDFSLRKVLYLVVCHTTSREVEGFIGSIDFVILFVYKILSGRERWVGWYLSNHVQDVQFTSCWSLYFLIVQCRQHLKIWRNGTHPSVL